MTDEPDVEPQRGVARLADVAERAGVGTSIASRVLNNDPTVGVRDETRARVIAAATELNYRPNAAARGLKLARTTTLGLVIPNLAHPVNAEIIHGAERAASAAGYVLLLADADEFLRSGGAYRRLLLERRIDGLLLASATTSEPFLRGLAQAQLPVLLVNRRAGASAPSVTVDDALGMSMAVRHLIALGHTRIGYISGPPDADTAARRLAGYLAELRSSGLKAWPSRIVESSFDEESGFRASLELIQRWKRALTAVAVWSMPAAIGVLAGLKSERLSVPNDISVIAFHDAPIAAYLEPSLTTVRMPLAEMAARAVEVLIDLIEGRKANTEVIATAPVVVERNSACPSKTLRSEKDG